MIKQCLKIKFNKHRSLSSIFLLGLLLNTQAFSASSTGFFGQNAASDGPITICSNSLHFDQEKNELVYEGNVTVLQIKDLAISCSNNLTKNSKNMASLWVSPETNNYNQMQQEGLAIAKKLCKEKGNCRYMSGQKLTVYLDEEGQAKQVDMIAYNDKEKLPVAKYYSLETDKKGKTTTSYAYGKLMEFEPEKNLLTIEKNAYITQKNNSFNGDKITYNTQTGVVDVPKQAYQRATMIISSDETKKVGK